LLQAASARLATAARDTAASRLLAIGPPPGLVRAEVRTRSPVDNRGHGSVKMLSISGRANMTDS
jgi:hypothetical protein